MHAESVDGVEPTFLEEAPIGPDIDRVLVAEHGLPFYVDVDRPEEVPADETERMIDLAERVLSAAGRRTGFGHHEEIRQSMAEWAPDRGEDRAADPGYWRRMTFALSPRERNFGCLNGDHNERVKKAKTVLAWASDCIDADILETIEQSQFDDIEQAWRDAVAAEKERREIEAFARDPPDACAGWSRFDATHESVEVAYQATNHGTPVVAAVYRTIEGELVAREFTVEKWAGSGENPHEARWNRPCVSNAGDGAYARLWSHLQTFNVESTDAMIE
ncbi:hypothetical protein [Haloarcula nitratireducens]|uniref:Uncharacterized protein n=1 Tax=Haloarcula nitratireducens TaxID=2487749 RepID=A0AAW4PH97_9EURY|nr:hypothetical protein [Halomicroarcula nitratireducens]MBX0296815.1 hypothetical protein [Halomicroarcula nitratireducens]